MIKNQVPIPSPQSLTPAARAEAFASFLAYREVFLGSRTAAYPVNTA